MTETKKNSTTPTLLLSRNDIEKKLIRMAYEIAEQHDEEEEIVMVGIRDKGYEVAERLAIHLKQISRAKITLAEVTVNKQNPVESEIKTNLTEVQIRQKVLVFVDDVANSGKTLLYAMKPLMNFLPKKVSVAVLIDRKHKLFPVSPDIVGLSLSTNMQEHILVKLGTDEGAYLTS